MIPAAGGLRQIRVLIAEGHGLMRTVLREVLSWEPGTDSKLPTIRTIVMGLYRVACLRRDFSGAGAAGFIVKRQTVEGLGLAGRQVSGDRPCLPRELKGGLW